MTSQQENLRDIWRTVRAAWTAGDQETIERYIDPELVVTEPDCLPYSGKFIGPEGYARLFLEISAVWDDMTIEHGSVIGGPEDDALVIEYFTTARSRKSGQWLRHEPNLAIWKFRNGKVISMTPFNFDTKKILDVIG